MMYISLTQGHFAIVDDEDFEYLDQFKWCFHSGGYACRRQEVDNSKKYEIVLMHRLLFGFNRGNSNQIDHINGNKLDNRRSNLRSCTQSQNMANIKKRDNASSRFKGVTWYKAYKKWAANIQRDYKQIHIGYFKSEIDAAYAYNEKATELFGVYAKLNEIT